MLIVSRSCNLRASSERTSPNMALHRELLISATPASSFPVLPAPPPPDPPPVFFSIFTLLLRLMLMLKVVVVVVVVVQVYKSGT